MLFFAALSILGGPWLAYRTWVEWQTYGSASREPVYVELSDLESGMPPPDKHLWIGKHWALYSSSVTVVRRMRSRVARDMYYPIVSEHHPYREARKSVTAPTVLVFASDPPDYLPRIREEESVTGLVLSDIDLGGDAIARLTKAYPDVDLNDVIILVAGEAPIFDGTVLVFGIVGAALFVAGAYVLVQEYRG